MSAKDKRNSEGYSDPTAYAAMRNLNREEDRINKLRRAILNICEVAGVEIQGSLDEICSQLRRLSEQVKQMKRAEPLGVIIAAGETAYLGIRKVFPEDTETVKVKPCPYLEKDQCFAIQNRSFPIMRDWR